MTTTTLELTKQLIARASITPADDGCLDVIGQRLSALGFDLTPLRYGEVHNLWARHGSTAPLFVFAGHTDVVPPGPSREWTSEPFMPSVRDGWLYGRGAADMKGSIAAMLTALERLFASGAKFNGSLGLMLTSDEEGLAIDGTRRMIEYLTARGERIDWCLIGEPSCAAQLGDTIRTGRRGSLNGRLQVRGTQGHVAYPQRAHNPIHEILPLLAELCATQWDQGNDFFPPTSFQISNIHAGTGAENVIPGELSVWFNFRFSTESTEQTLKARAARILERQSLDYSLDWQLSGAPFLSRRGKLNAAICSAVTAVTGLQPAPSTGGGTSDGRFIAPTGAEVIEFGPVNASIHKIDECVNVAELDQLSTIYEQIIVRLLAA